MADAILFDLDGTLVDSAGDLTDAVNALLARAGLPPHPEAAVRRMIGHGIAKLVERAFVALGAALTDRGLQDRTAEMMAIYGAALTRRTTTMPAARETLAVLAADGHGIAVVTNKPTGFAHTILGDLGLTPFVQVVMGGDSDLPRKPAPDMLLAACAALGASSDTTWMVGDSAADMQAARAAGMRCILVRGGYTDTPVDAGGAARVLDSLGALPDAMR